MSGGELDVFGDGGGGSLSGEGDDVVVDELAAVDGEAAEGAVWLATALHRRARVEQPLTVDPFDVDGFVAVTEDDEIGGREPTAQPGGTAGCGPRVVHHPHTHARQLDLETIGQPADEIVVVVAQHGVHREPRPQLVEQVSGDDIARVQHDVGIVDVVPHRGGELREVLAQVGVGEHQDTEIGSDPSIMPFDARLRGRPPPRHPKSPQDLLPRWSAAAPLHRCLGGFVLDDGEVFHTYSTYARGADILWGMYQWLDRAPLGRNDGAGRSFRRHDEYDPQ